MSEANLDTYAYDKTGYASHDVTLSSGDFLCLAAYNGTATFDEVRWGTTLADVTPEGEQVPEPGMLPLLFFGMCGLLARAWRNCK